MTQADSDTHELSEEYKSVYNDIVKKRIDTKIPMAVGKHTAANAKYCKETIEALQATGHHSAADWGIWMLWWRMMDWQTAKHVDEMRLEDASQFRDEVLSALLECQNYDALYNRLMGLIDRTVKNANDR